MNTAKQAEIKASILEAALKLVPFRGWTNLTLEEASKKAGQDINIVNLLFEDGIDSLLSFYIHDIDSRMLSEFTKKYESKTLKIHEKIYQTLIIRLEILNKHKAVANKTVSYLSMPWNITLANKLLWNTVDIIWRDVCKDTSTDFNYYTKRTLLYGVYTSTVMYWLSDDSEDFKNTRSFLERRLQDVLKVGGFISKFKKANP